MGSYLCSWFHLLQIHGCRYTKSYQPCPHRLHSYGSCLCPGHTHQCLLTELYNCNTWYCTILNSSSKSVSTSAVDSPIHSNPLLEVHKRLLIMPVSVALTRQSYMSSSHSSMSDKTKITKLKYQTQCTPTLPCVYLWVMEASSKSQVLGGQDLFYCVFTQWHYEWTLC